MGAAVTRNSIALNRELRNQARLPAPVAPALSPSSMAGKLF